MHQIPMYIHLHVVMIMKAFEVSDMSMGFYSLNLLVFFFCFFCFFFL